MPHREQRIRTDDRMRELGLQAAFFSDPDSVTWLSGYAPPRAVGTTPFLGHPGFVWYEDGSYTLLVQDGQSAATAGLAADPDMRVASYLSFTVDAPIAVHANMATLLSQVLGGARRGPVGIECLQLPLHLHETLASVASSFEPIDGLLVPLRMVKTDEELLALRRNFSLTDVGHAAARHAVTVGAREIDVWTSVQGGIQRHAGKRVTLGNDCVAGSRLANIGGWPGTAELRPHDSLILDLSTNVEGYWSDSCMTYYASGPNPHQRELHALVLDALAYGETLLRPGVVARDVDANMRAFMERAGVAVYPHHSGHGVGVSPHEEPRLTPYDTVPLEPGMVVMLEPGVYEPGVTAVRIEHAYLITDTGPERLTTHDTSI